MDRITPETATSQGVRSAARFAADALPEAQERFIRNQIAGLREMGFPETNLAFEERSLRSGFRTSNLICGLFEHSHAAADAATVAK